MNESIWYNTLQRPWFAPPSWIFGPVWTVLYIMIAIALVLSVKGVMAGKLSKMLIGIIAVNIVSNALFTPLQFGLQSNLLALIDITAVLISLYMWLYFVRSHSLIFWLLVPYAAWVSFATILQVSITVLNW